MRWAKHIGERLLAVLNGNTDKQDVQGISCSGSSDGALRRYRRMDVAAKCRTRGIGLLEVYRRAQHRRAELVPHVDHSTSGEELQERLQQEIEWHRLVSYQNKPCSQTKSDLSCP